MNFGQRFSKLFIGKIWEYAKKNPASVVGYTFCGFISSNLFVFSYERILLKSRLHFGFFVPEDEKFDGNFTETDSSKKLIEILSPEVDANSYYIVTGDRSIGKSSAATRACDMLGHRGVVYIKVPKRGDPKDFEKSLAKRLFLHHMVYHKFFSYFTLLPEIDFPNYDGEIKDSYLSDLMVKLCVLSHQYKRWHGDKGLVLVIDEVDNFLVKDATGHDNGYYLDILQNTAKSHAVSYHQSVSFTCYPFLIFLFFTLRIAEKLRLCSSRGQKKR